MKQRAMLLGASLKESDGWRKGPIELGAGNSFLHQAGGTTCNTAKAYECGAIISKSFAAGEPPDDLGEWLQTAFRFYDQVLTEESAYIEAILPPVSDSDWKEQASAAVTGEKAERYFFEEWCGANRPEWGEAVDKTRSTGLGYDFEFPQAGLYVEVKGFRRQIDDVRLTEKEWQRAKEKRGKYVLCLISELDSGSRPRVDLLFNPYKVLAAYVSAYIRRQITYSVPARRLKESVM